MSQLIMNALIKEAEAKEAKAIANLQNYMSNAAGIGDHPICCNTLKEYSVLFHVPSYITIARI